MYSAVCMYVYILQYICIYIFCCVYFYLYTKHLANGIRIWVCSVLCLFSSAPAAERAVPPAARDVACPKRPIQSAELEGCGAHVTLTGI